MATKEQFHEYYIKNRDRYRELGKGYRARLGKKRLSQINKVQYARRKFGLTLEEYERRTKECCICGFKWVVELHHVNGKEDNEHLLGLCPNHHKIHHNLKVDIKDLNEY